jgi:hypothetical protein
MPPILVLTIYIFIAVGAYLIVDALGGLLRAARGADDEAVERRLQHQSIGLRSGETYDVTPLPRRDGRGTNMCRSIRAFCPLDTSGTGISLSGRSA